jgi:hypothetical protein
VTVPARIAEIWQDVTKEAWAPDQHDRVPSRTHGNDTLMNNIILLTKQLKGIH